jgi:hypothetical protein
MPVKTKRDEHKWQKAKDIAEEAGQADNYAYIMGIYKKMKPDYEFKSGPAAKKAAQRLALRWAKRVLVRDLGGDVLPEDALFLRRIGPNEAYRAGDFVFLVDPRTKRVLKKTYDKRGAYNEGDIMPPGFDFIDPGDADDRVMPPGFDFIDPGDEEPLPVDLQAQDFFEKQVGGRSETMRLDEVLHPQGSQKLRKLLGYTFQYIRPQKGWFVFPGNGVAAGGQARRLGQQIFRNLMGRRGLGTSVVKLHDVPLWIGTQDGTAIKVDPPVKGKRAAGRRWIASLFSDTGKLLHEETFEAPNERVADEMAAKLMQPHVRRHRDAEDWVVEPA